MKRILLLTTISAGTLLTGTTALFAQMPTPEPGNPHVPMVHEMKTPGARLPRGGAHSPRHAKVGVTQSQGADAKAARLQSVRSV